MDALNRAAAELPIGYQLRIELERGCGEVKLFDPVGNYVRVPYEPDEQLNETVYRALQIAIRDNESEELRR